MPSNPSPSPEGLREALEKARAFIASEYHCERSAALEGHPIATEARPVFKAICDALYPDQFAENAKCSTQPEPSPEWREAAINALIRVRAHPTDEWVQNRAIDHARNFHTHVLRDAERDVDAIARLAPPPAPDPVGLVGALEALLELRKRLHEQLGEAVHTGFRKGADGGGSAEVWQAIAKCTTYGDAISFAIFGLEYGLEKKLDAAEQALAAYRAGGEQENSPSSAESGASIASQSDCSTAQSFAGWRDISTAPDDFAETYFLVRPRGQHPAWGKPFVPTVATRLGDELFSTLDHIKPLQWNKGQTVRDGPTSSIHEADLEWMPFPADHGADDQSRCEATDAALSATEGHYSPSPTEREG